MKKIAVITGASSGMGKRFAETVDRYGTFDEVWVIARHEAQLESLRATVPFPVRVLALDLTDRGSFDVYATALAETPVEVGLLMNCSGYGKFSAVLDTPLAVNLNMTDLNCQTVVAMCQLTAPYMPSGSQIINIASVAGLKGCGGAVYVASKGAIVGITKHTALRFASEGVRCNAICPSTVVTPMTTGSSVQDIDPDMIGAMGRHMDLKIHPCMPDDVAKIMLFLISDDSRALTGQALVADFGATL